MVFFGIETVGVGMIFMGNVAGTLAGIAPGWAKGRLGSTCAAFLTVVRVVSIEASDAASPDPIGFAGSEGCGGTDEPGPDDACSICLSFASILAILSSVLEQPDE